MNNSVNVTFVMPNITELAKVRSEATQESYTDWYNALNQGVQLANEGRIDPDAFLMVVNNSIKCSQFILIMESLRTYSKENPYGTNAFNLLIFYADRSNYTLKDWVEVLDYFYNWLAKNCRKASFETILNYILNCIGGRNWLELRNFRLTELVEQFLGTYGFQD